MVLQTREIVQIMADLASHENIRVNVSQSVRGAVITGATTLLGGMFLGRKGLALGAVVGGLTAASTSSDFRPIAEILLYELTPAQQAQLVNRVNNVIRSIDASDMVTVGALIASSSSLRGNLLSVLRHFITNDLSYSLA